MIRLIQNEHKKLWAKRGTIVLFLVVVVMNILMAVFARKLMTGAGVSENFLGYVSFTTPSLSLVSLLAIVIAGSIISSEFERGTIKFLLIRPHSRIRILVSKYITMLLFALYLTVTYFFLSILLGIVFFQWANIEQDINLVSSIMETYEFHLIECVVMATIAFTISALFRNTALAISLSIVVMIGGVSLFGILTYFNVSWGKYILFANIDFEQYTNGNKPPFEGMTWMFSLTTLSIYMILFFLVTWFSFCKRDCHT